MDGETTQTSVLIADPHAVFRSGLRMVLESRKALSVLGEAADGHELVDLAKRLRPDVIVTEIALPRLSGLEAARQLAQANVGSRVLVLTMHESQACVQEALRAGVAGYLVKSGSTEELLQAIAWVRQDKIYISPAVVRHVVERVTDEEKLPGSVSALTGREREVLQLIAEGLSSKEIAGSLGVSVKTVDSHRARLMEKTGIHKVSGLVRFAIREGLVSP